MSQASGPPSVPPGPRRGTSRIPAPSPSRRLPPMGRIAPAGTQSVPRGGGGGARLAGGGGESASRGCCRKSEASHAWIRRRTSSALPGARVWRGETSTRLFGCTRRLGAAGMRCYRYPFTPPAPVGSRPAAHARPGHGRRPGQPIRGEPEPLTQTKRSTGAPARASPGATGPRGKAAHSVGSGQLCRSEPATGP